MTDFTGYSGQEGRNVTGGGVSSATEHHPVANLQAVLRARRLDNQVKGFWSKVDKNGFAPTARPDLGPCWLWTGPTNGKGYGQLSIDKVRLGAHDFFYRLLVGPVPAGLELDHLCRIKLCVNPAHLEPVSHRENMRRVPALDRRAGALARNAALTPERRSEIARMAALTRWGKAPAVAAIRV